MSVKDDHPYSPYDVRHASAQVRDEEPLRTPRGTRPIDGRWIRLEWMHGKEEPVLQVGGMPLFKRTRHRAGSDAIVRCFRPSDYRDGPLPVWVSDFYQRHDPNPRSEISV
jgi:hypothetical protein